MLRKFFKVLIATALIVTMTGSVVYAKPYIEAPPIETGSNILPRGVKESRVHVTSRLRGVFFAAADLAIINKDGEIGVSAKTYMREPVDEVYISIYLDRLGEDGKWTEVSSYEFEFYSKDYPEGLTEPGVDFTIGDQPSKHTYRLRGAYAAFKDGAMEGFGPVTDGVFIE